MSNGTMCRQLFLDSLCGRYNKNNLSFMNGLFLWQALSSSMLFCFFWSRRSFDDAIKLAIALIDRNSMSLEDYVARCKKGRSSMEQTFRDRAYKMLTIANPNNGDGFFQLIFNYNWSKKGVVALTKEKLYMVATSRVHAKRCIALVLILLYHLFMFICYKHKFLIP